MIPFHTESQNAELKSSFEEHLQLILRVLIQHFLLAFGALEQQRKHSVKLKPRVFGRLWQGVEGQQLNWAQLEYF